jgi:hypothetical protein
MFKVGDKVKLVSYLGFGDWADHKDQIGTIVEINSGGYGEFNYRIVWEDGASSRAPLKNLRLICIEWDPEFNLV